MEMKGEFNGSHYLQPQQNKVKKLFSNYVFIFVTRCANLLSENMWSKFFFCL